jgi:hypothetical protein
MGEIFAVQKKLDNLTIEWVPGCTVITCGAQGEPFKEPEFFKAMMSIWLGPDPADWRSRKSYWASKKSQQNKPRTHRVINPTHSTSLTASENVRNDATVVTRITRAMRPLSAP